MYNEITVDRSLLYIDQHHVDTFKSLAKKMSQFNFIIEDGGLRKEDAWVIAFNTWLMLLPDKYNIIQSAEKTIYYSSNFVIYKALVKDIHFNYLKKHSNATDKLFYLASLMIANKLNQWFIYIKDKYELVYITEQNSTINYFDLDNHLENEELQQFLEDQAHFVKASIKEMNSTDSFQIAIKQACDEAFVIYTSHFVSQPHKV